jgi:DnaJ-class molecular chaperone
MKTECPTCHGHKVIDVCTVTGHIVAGEFHTEKTSWQQVCPTCEGTGWIEPAPAKEV